MNAKLISHTTYPVGTLLHIWMQSRSNNFVPDPETIDNILSARRNPANLSRNGAVAVAKLGYADPVAAAEDFKKTFLMLLQEDVPVIENVHFTFALTNIPISLREQLVRHRIGVGFDPRVGADLAPSPESGLLVMNQLGGPPSESSWWSQTARAVPMNDFADRRAYFVDPALRSGPDVYPAPVNRGLNAEEYFVSCMHVMQQMYQTLLDAGYPYEVCRNVLPMAVTHSMTWTLNLKTLLHVIGKRTCWISQGNLWNDLILQIVADVKQLSPLFDDIVEPICVHKGEFTGCVYLGLNGQRITGKGEEGQLPCPLYLYHHQADAIELADACHMGDYGESYKPQWDYTDPGYDVTLVSWVPRDPADEHRMAENVARYRELWGVRVLP